MKTPQKTVQNCTEKIPRFFAEILIVDWKTAFRAAVAA